MSRGERIIGHFPAEVIEAYHLEDLRGAEDPFSGHFQGRLAVEIIRTAIGVIGEYPSDDIGKIVVWDRLVPVNNASDTNLPKLISRVARLEDFSLGDPTLGLTRTLTTLGRMLGEPNNDLNIIYFLDDLSKGEEL
jgi:hypothetical protein